MYNVVDTFDCLFQPRGAFEVFDAYELKLSRILRSRFDHSIPLGHRTSGTTHFETPAQQVIYNVRSNEASGSRDENKLPISVRNIPVSTQSRTYMVSLVIFVIATNSSRNETLLQSGEYSLLSLTSSSQMLPTLRPQVSNLGGLAPIPDDPATCQRRGDCCRSSAPSPRPSDSGAEAWPPMG